MKSTAVNSLHNQSKRWSFAKGECATFLYYNNNFDTVIQSNLRLIRLHWGQSPLEQCGVKGFAQGPLRCADLILAALGLESPTVQVPVMCLSH